MLNLKNHIKLTPTIKSRHLKSDHIVRLEQAASDPENLCAAKASRTEVDARVVEYRIVATGVGR
jgi:hypothetical protein